MVCGKLTHSSWLGLVLLGRNQGRLTPATVSSLRVPAWPSGGQPRLPIHTRSLPPRVALSHGVSRALWGGSRLNISLMAPREGSHTPHGLRSRGEGGAVMFQLGDQAVEAQDRPLGGSLLPRPQQGSLLEKPQGWRPGPSLEGEDILSLQDTPPPSWPAGPLRPGLSS